MKSVDRVSEALDAALEMTFPASDPIAVYMPEAEVDGLASAAGNFPEL